MSDFQSESYKVYLDAHTRLNQYVKVSTAAVDYLYKAKADNKELSGLINDLVLKSGERWTPTIITDPQQQLTDLKNDLCKSAIIWVFSAVDAFYKQVEGQLSSFYPASIDKDSGKEIKDSKRKQRIVELYAKLNWDLANIEPIIPVLNFYEAIRHSVAHNMGYPSRELIEISESEDFKNAILNWKTKFEKKKISPPPIVDEQQIYLNPHHSITYSETCLRIVKDINNRLLVKLGMKYFIDKIIKNYILDTNSLVEPQCKDYVRYIIYHMRKDYNLVVKPYNKINESYSDDEIKNYKKRYSVLKNQ